MAMCDAHFRGQELCGDVVCEFRCLSPSPRDICRRFVEIYVLIVEAKSCLSLHIVEMSVLNIVTS